ncbi:GIY-YIG nuclease family protein [bacterium]|nr:MAG: GIY-YIG nuclease family protein [bacterium]
MYYVYVIKSLEYGTRYVGSSDNILRRVSEHNLGKCRYTSGRKPWKLVYKEKFETRSEAMKRERFLKSGQGRKWLDDNLKR